MKKSHLVLLLVTGILALSSAYSLAAINQVYNIGFEWYSQLNGRYESELRDVSQDRCILQAKQLSISMDSDGSNDDYIYINCSLGNVSSPEYRIKIVNIAQRGNNLEVRVSLNTPEKLEKDESVIDKLFKPVDTVRIKRTAFPSKGRLYVIFKNQDGKQLYQQYCEVG
jgi:hypothetical protein